MGETLTVVGVVVSAALWLDRRMGRIERRQDRLDERFEFVECCLPEDWIARGREKMRAEQRRKAPENDPQKQREKALKLGSF